MAGFRVGFAVGGARLIDALSAYRTNVGYGAPSVVQRAAAYALDHFRELATPVADGYRVRVWHRGERQPPVEATERTFNAALTRCYAEARP